MRKPKYSLADYAELKGLHYDALISRMRRSDIDLDEEMGTKFKKGGGFCVRWTLDYLEKTLKCVTDDFVNMRGRYER